MHTADQPESRGCPSPSTPHALGDTYRAREAVAAVNRRRCPRDPIAPERSKQQSESWWEAGQEPPPRCCSARALTSTAGLDEEHFRLVLQTRAVGIVKDLENLLQLPERKEGEGRVSSHSDHVALHPAQDPQVGQGGRARAGLTSATRRHAPEAVCRPHHRRHRPRRETGGPLCRSP